MGSKSLRGRLYAAMMALRDSNIQTTIMSFAGNSSMEMRPEANNDARGYSSVELHQPLTTVELHNIMTRRFSNLQLPDDNHTLLAESLMAAITTVSSLFARLYVLNLQPVQSLSAHWPRVVRLLQVLILSQLHPFRVLQAPLLRVLRPLHWLLVPFAAMATPLALHITIRHIVTYLFSPLHTSTDISSRQTIRSNSAHLVQAIIDALRLLRDRVNSHARSAPHFSSLSLVLKPSMQTSHRATNCENNDVEQTDVSHAETTHTQDIICNNRQSEEPESKNPETQTNHNMEPSSPLMSTITTESCSQTSISGTMVGEVESHNNSHVDEDRQWQKSESKSTESPNSNHASARVIRLGIGGLTPGKHENGTRLKGLAALEGTERRPQHSISRVDI